MTNLKTLTSIASLIAVSSCASIVEGKKTKVEVIPTPRTANAVNCQLENERGNWSVAAPGTVEVIRSKTDLKINCVDMQTQAQGNKTLESDFESWFFGNLLIPIWPIWMGVDAGTGSMWDYDKEINVVMPISAVTPVLQQQPVTAPVYAPAQPIAAVEAPAAAQPVAAQAAPQKTLAPAAGFLGERKYHSN